MTSALVCSSLVILNLFLYLGPYYGKNFLLSLQPFSFPLNLHRKLLASFQKCFKFREFFQISHQLSCSLCPVQHKHRQVFHIWLLSSYVLPVIHSNSWTRSFTNYWKKIPRVVVQTAPKYTGKYRIWRKTWYCGQSFPQKMHAQGWSQGI